MPLISDPEAKEKADQINYALVCIYGEVKREESEQAQIDLIKHYKKKIGVQQTRVDRSIEPLNLLHQKCGLPLHGSNNYTENNSKPKLTPEQQTQLSILKDEYQQELIILNRLKNEELQDTLSTGTIDPFLYIKHTHEKETISALQARKHSHK